MNLLDGIENIAVQSTFFIWASLMSLIQTKRASEVLNYNPGTCDNYLHHWVDATAGGRFVPEGITSPVASTSVFTWISIIWSFLSIFCLQNLEFLEKLRIFLPQE